MIHGPSQIARPDRFCWILPISGRRGRSPGPRMIANRAHTRGFRAILRKVRKLTDWMVEQAGFEPATPGSGMFGKLSATLAQYLAEDNSGNAGENLIAGNSPLISEPPCAFSWCFGTRTFGHPAADFGPAGLASEAKQSNVYGCPLRRLDSP